MVDPTGEISKSVAQTLRNWSETISNNKLLESVDFIDLWELSDMPNIANKRNTQRVTN